MEKNLVRVDALVKEANIISHKAPLKVALIGYGKMGKILELKAKEMGYEVGAIIPSKFDQKYESSLISAKNADIFIDFSHPDAVVENVKLRCP